MFVSVCRSNSVNLTLVITFELQKTSQVDYRDANKLSEALTRLANAPEISIRQLAKALASYKKKIEKKWEKN